MTSKRIEIGEDDEDEIGEDDEDERNKSLPLTDEYSHGQFAIHIDAEVSDNSCWFNGSWTELKTGLGLRQLL